MNKPLVSVLITTYNYGRFIEEAIDSVLSQDYPQEQIEIVVVDDGSTDDTAERVKRFGSRVNYFYQPNGGQASALNLGFAKARGEIISLLDGDDFFLPGKVSRVAKAFQQDPALGMVYHPMESWNMETGERQLSQFPLTSGSPFEDMRKFAGYAGPGTCASFRRKFLDRLLPIPREIRMMADAYPGGLVVFVASIQALPERLSACRVHGQNSFPFFANIYRVNESQMPVEARKSKLQLSQTVVRAMRRWLFSNGYIVRKRFARYFLAYWYLYLLRERFLVTPPGRLRFFWFALLDNYVNGPFQARKLIIFNYLCALTAPVFGYEGAGRMYDWRAKALQTTVGAYRALFGNRMSSGSNTPEPRG